METILPKEYFSGAKQQSHSMYKVRIFFFHFKNIYFYLGVCARMYACHNVCRCLVKLEENVRAGVGVTSVCELPSVDAGN